jgi:hypothetical protein
MLTSRAALIMGRSSQSIRRCSRLADDIYCRGRRRWCVSSSPSSPSNTPNTPNTGNVVHATKRLKSTTSAASNIAAAEEVVVTPTRNQLWLVFLRGAVPFIGFGFIGKRTIAYIPVQHIT